MQILKWFRPTKFETAMNSRIAQLESILATNTDFSLSNTQYWEFVRTLETYKEILQLYRETK